jgi:hypothetical protein
VTLPIRFASISDLLSESGLTRIVGPLRSVMVAPLVSNGTTRSAFQTLYVTLETGETRRFVAKHIDLNADWTAVFSGDRIGREALILEDPECKSVWIPFRCPYVGFAAQGMTICLLMHDLTACVWPTERSPLPVGSEESLIVALAEMHAAFWHTSLVTRPWLAQPHSLADLSRVIPRDSKGIQHPFAARVSRGWELVHQLLPARVNELLALPGDAICRAFGSSGVTLLHGDAKIANFAFHRDGSVSAFDWALLGAGPVAIEMGWYIARNARTLSRSKEDTLKAYHNHLIMIRPESREDLQFDDFLRHSIVWGALRHLWRKALALDAAEPGSELEWEWWAEHLSAI